MVAQLREKLSERLLETSLHKQAWPPASPTMSVTDLPYYAADARFLPSSLDCVQRAGMMPHPTSAWSVLVDLRPCGPHSACGYRTLGTGRVEEGRLGKEEEGATEGGKGWGGPSAHAFIHSCSCICHSFPAREPAGTDERNDALEVRPCWVSGQEDWADREAILGLGTTLDKNAHFELPLSSVQFSPSVVSDSSRLCGRQHTRLPCPSPTPRDCSNSCPLGRGCHPTISSSVIPFSSCLQSFPASGSFPVSQFFTKGGQSIRVSASASVLPMNIQD